MHIEQQIAARKLSLRLKRSVQDSFKSDLYLMILYDSSGSINTTQFAEEIECGLRLINSFPPNVKISTAQYSSDVAVTAGFDSSRTQLLDSQRSMQFAKLDRCTRTDLALLHATSLMNTQVPKEAIKMVVLITDGCPDSQTETVQAAKTLVASGASLIGIGVGNLNLSQLEAVCGKPNTYLVQSWSALASALRLAPNSALKIVPDSDVFIEAVQAKVPIKLDDPIPLTVTIKNAGVTDIAAGSILKLKDANSYYQAVTKTLESPISMGQKESFSLVLEPYGAASAENLPEVVEWTLRAPDSDSYYYITSEGFEVQTHNMFGEFLGWTPPPNTEVSEANILLFGWTGAGKSRLFNSMASLFNIKQSSVAEELGAADHVTKQLTSYKVADGVQDPAGLGSLKFKFWDTYGLSRDTYKSSYEFDRLVDGALPAGWKRNDTRKFPQADKANLATQRMHCVVFVLPAGATGDKGILSQTRSYIERAVVGRRMAPIVVVTHADVLEPEEWEQTRANLARELGRESRVFLLDNSEQMAKTFQRDKALYLILRSALAAASEFIREQARQAMIVPAAASSAPVVSPVSASQATPTPQ